MATGTKVIAIPTDAAPPAMPDPAVVASMENHAAVVKKSQATARAAKRPTAPEAGKPSTPTKPKAAARAVAAPKKGSDKADPTEVAAYFASTGLTRKELAAVLGVSTSLIGTVAKDSGDRWSAERFAKARVQIDAAVKAAAKRAK
jgi:hypothetical protein